MRNFMSAAAEDKAMALTVARDSGIVPSPGLLVSVRARYLMDLRERLQRDQSVSSVVRASLPATDAFQFVERHCWEIVREGTEDVYRDAIMFLLAELDELRGKGDQAYVVDVSTGEIVSPFTPDVVFQPEPYMTEKVLPGGETVEVEVVPPPILDPKLTSAMIMKAQSDKREAEVVRLAADPVRGRAYLHLTSPQRIAELARQKLSGAGLRGREETDLKDCDLTLIEFGQEANESDLQSTNPFFHRLYSYSAILASRVMTLAGPGGEYWMSEVHGNRDEEVRWYAVNVRVRRAG